jgi:hypothetical protein
MKVAPLLSARNVPPWALNGRLRNRQAETQSSKLTCDPLVALSERIKLSGEFRLDSNAGVWNLDQNQARFVSRGYMDFAAFRGEFGGVFQQIPEDLLKSRSVADHTKLAGKARRAPR